MSTQPSEIDWLLVPTGKAYKPLAYHRFDYRRLECTLPKSASGLSLGQSVHAYKHQLFIAILIHLQFISYVMILQ